MDEMQQITLEQWMSWKEDIREKLKETAGNFVYIGFRLKQIRDSGMFGGAADIFEFAQKEYGLSKSTTSRFIAINEKFSEDGNSLELRPEFKAIGSSKLAEMLTLPDAECQMITERTTIMEIRELKNFGKQEVTEAAGEEEEELTPIEKCLVDYFKDKKDMLNRVIKAVYDDRFEEAAELMNPSGYATHKKGICFMFMYDFSTGVKLKILTEPQPVTMAWKELLLEVYSIFANIFEDGEEDVHKAYYGEQGKEIEKETKIETQKVEENQKNQGVEESVATSQQEKKKSEKEQKKQEQKKQEKKTVKQIKDDPEQDEVETEENVAEEMEAGDENGSDNMDPETQGLLEDIRFRADQIARELKESNKKELSAYTAIRAKLHRLDEMIAEIIKRLDMQDEEGEEENE